MTTLPDMLAVWACLRCGELIDLPTIAAAKAVADCPGDCLIVGANRKLPRSARTASSSRPHNPTGGGVGPGQGRAAPPEGV